MQKVNIGDAEVAKPQFQVYGDWLSEFAWSHYAKLTFREQVGATTARRTFHRWKRKMSAREHRRIEYVLVVERAFPGDNLHLHALLAGTQGVKMRRWAKRWFLKAGWAQITAYDPEQGIRYYVGKKFVKGEAEIVVSPGLRSTAKLDMLSDGSQN